MIEFGDMLINPTFVESLHITETTATYTGQPATLATVYIVHLVCTTGNEVVESFDNEVDADNRLDEVSQQIKQALNL